LALESAQATDSNTYSLANLAFPYQLTGSGTLSEVSANAYSETPKIAELDANTIFSTGVRSTADLRASVVIKVSPKSKDASPIPAEMSLFAAR